MTTFNKKGENMFSFFRKKSRQAYTEEKNDIQKLVENMGIERAAEFFASTVSEQLRTRELAYQFVLEELEAASGGDTNAKEFVSESGIEPQQYIGAMQNSRPEIDGSGGPQQLLIYATNQLSSDPVTMVEFRIKVVKNIMKKFNIGIYEKTENTLSKKQETANSESVDSIASLVKEVANASTMPDDAAHEFYNVLLSLAKGEYVPVHPLTNDFRMLYAQYFPEFNSYVTTRHSGGSTDFALLDTTIVDYTVIGIGNMAFERLGFEEAGKTFATLNLDESRQLCTEAGHILYRSIMAKPMVDTLDAAVRRLKQ